jgi:ATP-dependent DNA ligase
VPTARNFNRNAIELPASKWTGVIKAQLRNGLALLRVAEERGFEGVVSKLCNAPYRSGECGDWRKVKTTAWREANRERWQLFERGGPLSRRRRGFRVVLLLLAKTLGLEKKVVGKRTSERLRRQ